jgi:hypothetical protein
MKSAAASSVTAGKTATVGGDSRGSDSIPSVRRWTGKKKSARERKEKGLRREREGGRGSYPLISRRAAASISSGDRRSGRLHRAASSWRKEMMCILHITPWFLGKT